MDKHSFNGNNSQLNEADVNPAYVKFRSYQNIDSTWGYTIFMNSRPYLHFSRISLKNSDSGFKSREDAEIVAGLLVKMIRNGDLNPKLNKKLKDSLELKMKLNDL